MRALILAGLTLALAAPASAQSLYGSRGVGLPVPSGDARTAALGGLGIGLFGPHPTFLNPADAWGTRRRGAIVALQPSSTTIDAGNGTDAVSATRFPALQVYLPFGSRTVFTGGFGAFMDQNWAVQTRSQIVLGTDTATVVDRLESRGGISQLRVGASYALGPRVAIGVAGGLLTGSRTRTQQRRFISEDVPLNVVREETELSYAAPLAAIGAVWDPLEILRLSAGVTWFGEMDRSDDDEDAPDAADLSMPLQVAMGASGMLAPDLLAHLAGRWMGWSSAADDLGETAEDSWELGGGLEYTGLRSTRRVYPVRLGARRAALPFGFGGETPSEWSVSGGVGARLAGTDESPGALIDLAVERGTRGDVDETGLRETFWRTTVSISLFGL